MMRGISKAWALGFVLLLAGCSSKKAIITMPASGQGVVGDELSSTTLTPCSATSQDAGSCTMQVNQCPLGIGRVKVVREGKNLVVTPYCFIPAPADCPEASEGDAGGGASGDGDVSGAGGSESGPSSYEDPGDL